MERVVQVLVKAVVNWTKKVVSGIKSLFSMAEEVAKRLVVIELELLLFGVLKCLLGGTGRIASVAIFILEIIIILSPWKKD